MLYTEFQKHYVVWKPPHVKREFNGERITFQKHYVVWKLVAVVFQVLFASLQFQKHYVVWQLFKIKKKRFLFFW